MEELLFFIFGMIAEALGLKQKKPAVPPAPMSPAPPRRTMPAPGIVPAPANSPGAPLRPYTLLRRPDAGGPAVPVEATTASFDAQERDLLREAVPARDTPSVPNTAPLEPAPSLFAGTDDFVRAFILQEALGPPLCRRTSSS